MKNQYFGDVNDYRKYGLLRALVRGSGLSVCVGWMLTPDDGCADGKHTSYLRRPNTWRRHDPELFDHLQACLQAPDSRCVERIEQDGMIPGASFFREPVPTDLLGRGRWLGGLIAAASGHELVFLDPDNGIEVKSTPYGRANSDKFVYWREIKSVFEHGHSLLIYQHFPRRSRPAFVSELGQRLAAEVGISTVTALATSHVLFLLASQPSHASRLNRATQLLDEAWKGQFQTHAAAASAIRSANSATRPLPAE